MGHVEPDPENANRWVARELDDDDTCDPCRNNNGKLYKNRADAYADYPGGKGYVNCAGQDNCRGKVVKRGGGRNVTPEQAAFIATLRQESALFSARAFTKAEGPTEGLRMAAGVGATQMYIYDYIGGYDGVTAMGVVEALTGVTGDVDLHINSGGGSIFEGTAIHTTLSNYSAGTIRTHVDGVAASAASVIAMVGADTEDNPGGEIIVAPAATMMVHAGSGGAWGTAKDMRNMADVLDLLTESLAGVYASATGGTTAEWLDLMNSGDTWYSAQQAVDAKLASRLGGKPKADPEPATPAEDHHDIRRLITAALVSPFVPGPLDLAGIRNTLKGL